MFIQTETTPNPNTLKFLPGKIVSEVGPVEFINKDKTNNELVRNILSITGVNMVFLGNDFITVKKNEELIWDDLKHIIISLINDYYLGGKKSILNKTEQVEEDIPQDEVVKKINEILDTKIRPAVARDGGDIKFKSFKDGLVKVELKGSCSGCPSSVMTLKQGVQNLLCHYIPEVKNVEAL
ncbi:MAG: NifU family protein [Candidatus Pelagibacter sp.]